MKLSFAGLGLFSFLLGCAPPENSSDQIFLNSKNTSQIINGSIVTADDVIATHIVIVFDKTNGYICTGTIIEKNTILTAAHCLSPNFRQFEIIFSRHIADLDNRKEEVIRKATQVIINDDYNKKSKSATDEDQSDIGLIYFEGDLPAGYKQADIMFHANDLKKDTQVIIAGYGVTQVGWADVKYKKSEKFHEKMMAGEVFCDVETLDHDGHPTCIELSMSGEGELRKTQASIKYISQSEFVLDEKKSGTCVGDSGGPVFLEKEGRLYLVGVTSRGDLLCDGEGVYTSLPSFMNWILTH